MGEAGEDDVLQAFEPMLDGAVALETPETAEAYLLAGPLIGREAEMALLREAADATAQEHRRGEPLERDWFVDLVDARRGSGNRG